MEMDKACGKAMRKGATCNLQSSNAIMKPNYKHKASVENAFPNELWPNDLCAVGL